MISQNILSLRTRHGMTQEELAQKIGVARQTVAKWEAADAVPDLGNAARIAQLFDVSLDTLVRHDEDQAGYPSSLRAGSTSSESCGWASVDRLSSRRRRATSSSCMPEASFSFWEMSLKGWRSNGWKTRWRCSRFTVAQ